MEFDSLAMPKRELFSLQNKQLGKEATFCGECSFDHLIFVHIFTRQEQVLYAAGDAFACWSILQKLAGMADCEGLFVVIV